MKTINVLFIKCGKQPEIIEINDDLTSYQELVEGWIENVYPYKRDFVLVCNEEGIPLGLCPNLYLEYERSTGLTPIFGDVFIASLVETEEGTEYGSVKEEDVPYLMGQIHLIGKRFPNRKEN